MTRLQYGYGIGIGLVALAIPILLFATPRAHVEKGDRVGRPALVLMTSSAKKFRRSARPHCRQKCPPTGHIFALGCLSRLAETSRKAAKYWIDSVACRCS